MVNQTPTDETELTSTLARQTFLNGSGTAGSTDLTPNTQVENTDTGTTSDESVDLRAFDEVLGRLEAAADALEFPARQVGPTPRGDQHTATHWGIHFETEHAIHLGEATVDAGESGTFTAVVGEYDGNNFDPVHERNISVVEGVNTIDLDMALDPGEYLLTRDGSFPLRRGEWSDWESQSRDGLELKGGGHPEYSNNRFWYYYFDLNVAANENTHL